MSQRRPNILLITTDQQRYDALGINRDTALRTPNLDALAASGTNFSRCYVTCPVCIPARRSLLSGLHPDTHGMHGYQDGCEFNPTYTMPGVLSAAGYQTQLIGKLHQHPQRKRFGYDHMLLSDSGNHRPTSPYQRHNDYTDWFHEKGFGPFSNSHGIGSNSRTARPWSLPEEAHHTSWVAEQAARFFHQWRDPESPWFLHMSFVAPHPPLIPPQPYWDHYINDPSLKPDIGDWAPPLAGASTPRGLPADSAVGPFPSREIHNAIAGYYGLIQHIDDRIQFVLDQFFEYANPRADEPTYIIFSSDHGEMLGDHHLFRKSLPYEGSAHVPFFISGRHVDVPQRTCEALVSWEDIMPTILDLAGIDIPEGLDGRTLLPVIQGTQSSVRDALHGGCMGRTGSNHYVVKDEYKYIWFIKTNEEQLFNLRKDPHELNDLSADINKLKAVRELMHERMNSLSQFDYDIVKLTPCRNHPPRALWPNTTWH